MMGFVGRKSWFFFISAILMVVGVISLAVFGLKPGIDFVGGTSITFQFSTPVEQGQLWQEMVDLGYGEATIQNAGETSYIIHLREISAAEGQKLAEMLGESLGCQVKRLDYYLASPAVGIETVRNAGIAIIQSFFALL